MSTRSCGRAFSALVVCLAASAAEDAAALERAVATLPRPATIPADPAAPRLRLIDVSLDVLVAGGGSSATDHELEGLQSGGHDPHRNGFSFQGAELSLAGAVDPYFTAEAHLVATEEGVELEEAYARTTGLPWGLEAKAGYQLIEFGRINPTHPHAWAWLDQPVIASRLLGADGARSPGLRLAWLAPLPWFSQLSVGAYNADDASLASFRGAAGHQHEGGDPEASVGGRPWQADEDGARAPSDLLWSARWEHFADLGATGIRLGCSWLGGGNAAGGRSDLFGADLHARWKPAAGGIVREASFTIEAMLRRATVAEAMLNPGTPDEAVVGDGILIDRGGYAQMLVGLHERWSVGLRGEYAQGSGDSVVEDHETETMSVAEPGDDALRDRRLRLSPLVQYHPSEFSRVRLQYDHDRAEHLPDGRAHSVWLGLEVLIGAHPAHGY